MACSRTPCGTPISQADSSRNAVDRFQKIALGLAVGLALAAAIDYVPGLKDAEGRTFGIFKLNLFQDLLHSASALWALGSALASRRAAITFLRVFGTLYFLDGVMGVFIGSGFLDLGVIRFGVLDLPLWFKFVGSLPHLILGGIGILGGFGLANR
ncbi:MAG: DUF4383 domain-containing protein [Proteobacteria bacterium]|nr:DUF4383 domain-containing protein [Pseudomonadota bacterium]